MIAGNMRMCSDVSMGFLLAVFTGSLSMVIGMLYKKAGRRIHLHDALLLNTTLLFLGTLPATTRLREAPPTLVLMLALAGFLSTAGMLLMQKAMQDGNSGIAWAMGQSALAVPFAVGIVAEDAPVTWLNGLGLAILVGGMAWIGLRQQADPPAETAPRQDQPALAMGKSHWMATAFLCFAILGTGQSIITCASGHSYKLNIADRLCAMYAGGFLANLTHMSLTRTFFRPSRLLFKFFLALLTVGLACDAMVFVTLDRLAKAGMANIGYPIISGSCIAGYNLYSVLRLGEKHSRITWVAVCLMIAGLVLISV